MRSELELVLKAIEVAEEMGWPSKDDRVKVNVLRKQLEKSLADLRSQGWQGGR
ncbi:MAG: hypothetical protein ACMG55_18660 [Microcoleus sp.]